MHMRMQVSARTHYIIIITVLQPRILLTCPPPLLPPR